MTQCNLCGRALLVLNIGLKMFFFLQLVVVFTHIAVTSSCCEPAFMLTADLKLLTIV